MLGISCKRTDPVDFQKPLIKYIKENYSVNENKETEANIAKVHNSRTAMLQVVNNPDASDMKHALDTLTSYYNLLELVDQRFPFGQYKSSSFFSKTKVKAVMVPFKWYDSYRGSPQSSDYNVNYEKASVLFNMAAIHSLSAIREDRSNTSGLSTACKQFTSASSILAFLATHPEYEINTAVDLNANSYRMLSHLMLAQAQACFFEKAVQAKFSPGLIAKLASGTAQLFHHAWAASQKNPMKGWLTSCKYQWVTHFMYQEKCFNAAAHYWHSKTLLAEDEYGKEIAELYVARDMCNEAKQHERYVVSGLVQSRQKLYQMLMERLAEAVKDNESIYHYVVPRPNELKEIESKFVVKTSPFDPNPPAEAKNPFSTLVPVKVHGDAEAFQSQLKAQLTEMKRECQEATEMAKVQLSSMGLPAALEAMDTAGGFPANVWEKVSEVQYKGGMAALNELQGNVHERAQEAKSGLSEVREMLTSEAEDDIKCKQQWGSRWNRTPSQQITAAFHRDADTVDQYLAAAAKSDQDIIQEMQKEMTSLSVLTLSQAELEAQLPAVDNEEQKSQASVNLSNLLDQLTVQLETREKAIAELEQQMENIYPSIEAALIAAQPGSGSSKTTEQVYAEERKKLAPQMEAVATTLDVQKALLLQIQEANEEFVKTKSNNQAADARERLIHQVNTGVDKYNKLMANFNEGLKFYSDIVKDYLQPLKQTVTDFIVARNAEKQLILEQITSNLAQYNNQQPQQAQAQPQQPQAQPQQPQGSYPSVTPQYLPVNNGSAPNTGYQAAPAAANPYASAPAPQFQYQAPPANNPNMNFRSAAPVYPSYQQAPQQQASAANANANPAAQWDCPRCTFKNSPTAVVCAMCDADNPNPAPAQPAQQQQPQQQPAQASGWRKFFS